MTKILKKKFLIPIIAVLVIAGAGSGVAFYKHAHNSAQSAANKAKSTSGKYYNRNTANPTTNVSGGSNNGSTSNNGVSTSRGSDQTPGSTPASNVVPRTPVGTFVSNHRPNLSGNPAPNTESSTCSTTPGVSCKITFTMGSTVKSLPLQQTDGDGNTHWDWKIQDIGLTAGTWKISAVAVNGSNTASANDATEMVVGQ